MPLGICIPRNKLLSENIQPKGMGVRISCGLMGLVKIERLSQISPLLDKHVCIWPFKAVLEGERHKTLAAARVW